VIDYGKKLHSRVTFDTIEEAALAYDRAARKCGEGVALNYDTIERAEAVAAKAHMEYILAQKPKSSKYRGVSWHKQSKKWKAEIYYDGKQHYIGCFVDEVEAARAYERTARAPGSSGVGLNFPAEGERGVPQKHNPSKYRGVSWHKQSKKWVAQIYYDGKHHYIGCFVDEEEAARAWDRAARDRQGSSAMLNFPAEGQRGVPQKHNPSKYLGVSWFKQIKMWVAQIYYDC
jgi:hypothetical protein